MSFIGFCRLCPPHRVLAWVKPFASWKKGVYPFYAWEPVIMVGGRNASGLLPPVRDYVAAIPPVFTRRMDDPTPGKKPLAFCLWLFACLGATPEDAVDDLFPGSGAVQDAWSTYCAQASLDFHSVPETEPMFEGEAA